MCAGGSQAGSSACCLGDLWLLPGDLRGLTLISGIFGWFGKGVPAMRLTWKDAVSTVFMAAIVVIYVAFLNSTTAWLISSACGEVALGRRLGALRHYPARGAQGTFGDRRRLAAPARGRPRRH